MQLPRAAVELRGVELRRHLHKHHEGAKRVECVEHPAPRRLRRALALASTLASTLPLGLSFATCACARAACAGAGRQCCVGQPERAVER